MERVKVIPCFCTIAPMINVKGEIIIYSLGDLHKDGIIPNMTLLTKQIDFFSIEVTGSSVQELSSDNFIKEGEIVLSTGIGYESVSGYFSLMLQNACLAGAAAIVFTFKDESYTLPPDVIAIADSLEVPVFQIPWEYRFSDFQASLQKAIQQKEHSRYSRIQRTLMNYSYDSRPLSDAIKYISSAFNCPVKVKNIKGETMAKSGYRRLPEDPDFSISIDISFGNSVFGYLIFYFENSTENIQREFLARYVAFPLSIWFYRKKIEDITTARVKNDFVWNLAMGNFTSEAEALQQGSYLNFQLKRHYTCMAMHACSRNTDSQHVKPAIKTKVDINHTIEQILIEEAKQLHYHVMVGSLGEDFIIYFEDKGPDVLKQITEYKNTAEIAIEKAYSYIICYWGVGEGLSDETVLDYPQLYKSAASALYYCMESNIKSRFLTYRSAKRLKIISALSVTPEIVDDAKKYIGLIVENDTNCRSSLLQTLALYFQTNYNASQTARQLYINRQSVLHRLEKIEMITGLSINNHDDLFILEALLLVYYSSK